MGENISVDSIRVINPELAKRFSAIEAAVKTQEKELKEWARILTDRIAEQKVIGLIFVARQGAHFRHLLNGRFERLGLKDRPFMQTISLSRESLIGPNRETDPEIVKSLFHFSEVGEKRFIDHMVGSKYTKDFLMGLGDKLDPNSHYDFWSFDEMEGVYAGVWDYSNSLSALGIYPSEYLHHTQKNIPIESEVTQDRQKRLDANFLGSLLWKIGYESE